jgi:hypothetical protein
VALLRMEPRIDGDEGRGKHALAEKILQKIGNAKRGAKCVRGIGVAEVVRKDAIAHQPDQSAEQDADGDEKRMRLCGCAAGWSGQNMIIGSGGIASEEAEALLESCAGEGEEVCEGAVEGEDAAGEDAIGHGAAVGDLHGEAAEAILAVGHAGGAHGVGDEDGAVGALGSATRASSFRGGVDAVADEFGEEGVVGEDGAEDAGLAVVERAHGVEGVRGAGGSGGDGGAGFGGGGVGVAERDADTAGWRGRRDRARRAARERGS